MKTMPSLKSLLSLFLLMLSLGSARAALLQVEVYVPGYRTYALVIPNSNTGGRFLRASSGQLYTDRVARGETIRFVMRPTAVDYNKDGTAMGHVVLYGRWLTELTYAGGWMPFTSHNYTVPTHPALDRLEAYVQTLGENRYQAIPLGRR
jgi:hypothetical protein